VATIPVEKSPYSVVFTPDGTKAYVANFYSDNVSVIDTATQKVLDIIPVEKWPCSVAFTPDGTRAYVVNWGSNNVSVIDTVTKILTVIPVGKVPKAISIASIPTIK
jgi:YVTN family beta-propeller protein